MSKQPPPAPATSVVGPCPALIQISRTPRHWKFTQHHRTTRPSPTFKVKKIASYPTSKEEKWQRFFKSQSWDRQMNLTVRLRKCLTEVNTRKSLPNRSAPYIGDTQVSAEGWLVGCFGLNGPLMLVGWLIRVLTAL